MLSIDCCNRNERSIKMSILLYTLYLNFKKFILRIMKNFTMDSFNISYVYAIFKELNCIFII